MCYVFYVNIFASLTPIWTAIFIFPGRKNPFFGRVCIHSLRNCQRLETQVSPALYKVRKMPLVIITLGRTEDKQQNLKEHCVKMGEFVCFPILVSSLLSLTERCWPGSVSVFLKGPRPGTLG